MPTMERAREVRTYPRYVRSRAENEWVNGTSSSSKI